MEAKKKLVPFWPKVVVGPRTPPPELDVRNRARRALLSEAARWLSHGGAGRCPRTRRRPDEPLLERRCQTPTHLRPTRRCSIVAFPFSWFCRGFHCRWSASSVALAGELDESVRRRYTEADPSPFQPLYVNERPATAYINVPQQ